MESMLEQHERCLERAAMQHAGDVRKLREAHDQAVQTGNLRLFIANTSLATEREDRNKLVETAVAEYIRTCATAPSASASGDPYV